ncbi:hypothetical protein Ssi03_41910 [Sphaerisporangium siamense]|uniref:Uncharacterized protein n=1 Tax=Sphaerisporangium siamense TaxID=795645 RepID=A0A7W7GCH7_9ACTN|nr:hypothetical protein [Sphaerisporangium siamense]MBB4704587.1 hypothetical protein [Sphaerisporangium siamense]GII86201.1 hypothetical protein Ssi03_41910 [Sphaerisporangium siamense]
MNAAAEHGLAEFENVRQDEDGMLRATHIRSRREACGENWEAIRLDALVIRISETLKRAWS